MNILFFGDIVGSTGRKAVHQTAKALREKHGADLVVANCENSAHGTGITIKTAAALYDSGCDFLTGGNHMFDKAEQVGEVFTKYSGRIVRPANFEGDYPGRGWDVIEVAGRQVAIVNLHGQVFMERQFHGLIASPFTALDRILHEVPESAIILVDFHAEVTSEKRAMGFYAEGRVAAVLGTHTHVQTADAQVLPGGTAYITDVGMTGTAGSILGMKKEGALGRFLDNAGILEVDEGDTAEVGYVVVEIDAGGKASSIQSFLEKIPLPANL